jgi:hypothetical protein
MKMTSRKLSPLLIGGGQIEDRAENISRLSIPPKARHYANAQLDDYHSLARSHFRWKPPLRMELRARASQSHPLGTLGFGFWNDPFSISMGQRGAARRLPASPQAIWFFYGAPPNDLPIVPGIPGYGWKASCLKTPSIPSPLLLLLTAPAISLSLFPPLRKLIFALARRLVVGHEMVLTHNLAEWHTYSLDWHAETATFAVDGVEILRAADPPQGPLGFVTWIDNQYAIVSPEKGFRFGVIHTQEEQWLEISLRQLERIPSHIG